MDLDKLIQTLTAGGASQAEINEVIETYSTAKYEPKTVQMQPAFYLESDKQITIGKDKHTIRLINVDDLRRLLPKLIEFTRFLLAQSGSDQTVDDVLSQTNPMGMVGVVVTKLTEMNIKGDYPEWFAGLLEELAVLVSNEARTVTARDLISLPPSQLTDLILKVVEVNQQDFLALWASVPHGIRSTLSILGSRLTSVANRLNTVVSERADLFGGADSTGKPLSSSPSEKKRGSANQTSAAVA